VSPERLINPIYRQTRWLTRKLAYLGMASFFLMLAITTIDSIGAKLFSRPIPGGPEVVAVLQVLAIASAAGFLQVLGGHTKIDFFVDRLPARPRSLVAVFIQLLILLLFLGLCRESFLLGESLRQAGEVSSSARIPLYLPAYYMGFCFLVVNLALTAELLVLISEMVKRS